MYNKYKLNLIHNPEFLTARTAYEDFHNQFLIILGYHKECSHDKLELVKKFYEKYYSKAEIVICKSIESESMKLYANCFYATKIQFFNEIYLTCQKTGADYNTVRDLMVKYGWINPQHTDVPGHDGKLSFGGGCFPKETSAMLEFMKKYDIPHQVMEAVVNERSEMRKD
jgi:UDP-glucose 6-dehydrogenase